MMIWEPDGGSPTALYHWLPSPASMGTMTACLQVLASPQPESCCVDPWKILDRMCPHCYEIWHMISTSVDDARTTIRECTDVLALQGAYQLAEHVTLRNLLRSRLKKIGEIVPA